MFKKGVPFSGLTTTGTVLCWGSNRYGQLGDGTTDNSLHPKVVPNLEEVQAIASGSWHTCVLTKQTGVKCWGRNDNGQLGNGTTENVNQPSGTVVGLATGAAAIATGHQFACAVINTGGIKCWGENTYGQLGNGEFSSNETMPVNVLDLNNAQTISASWAHICALTSSGTAKCWGYNAGQLGDGTTTNRSSPVTVQNITNAQYIATAQFHSCALTSLGGVKCWGYNEWGQLGNGSTENHYAPQDVTRLTSGVSNIAANWSHTCALVTSQDVHCWGLNDAGQLGNGTTDDSYLPTKVADLNGQIKDLHAGIFHVCALTVEGTVQCWGRNNSGQLGDGTTAQRLTPVLVVTQGTVPTPTATPTQEPGPTAEQVVVFIPGIAGSQLVRDQALLPDKYVWPIFRDGPKEKMRLKPATQGEPTTRDNSIYTDDVIRNYNAFNIPLNLPVARVPKPHNPIYDPFLKRLVGEGKLVEYKTGGDPNKRTQSGCDTAQTNATLFVFPWDWRFGAVDAVNNQGGIDDNLSLSPNNVELLEEYILCVLQIHPDAEITLVSHSMGWFIGRTYVLENVANHTNHNIARHIAIAPPRLGAPKTIAMMLTGNWIPDLMSKELTRTLLEHFPGAHQLLPSKWFWDNEGSPFSVNNLLTRRGDIEFFEFQQVLQDYYISPAEGDFYRSSIPFVSNMQKVYQNPAFADLRGDTSEVEYHIIYGVITDEDGSDTATTINKVSEKPIWGYDGILELYKEYDYGWTTGDETVPEFSAAAKNDTIDLNGNATLHKLTGDAMEHQAMMSEAKLQDCVFALLNKGRVCDNVSAATTSQPTPARYIKLWGVDEVSITDGISTTQNLISTTLTLGMFPDVSAKYLGDHSIMFIVKGNKQYTVNFTGQGEYFESESDYGFGDSNLRTIHFSPEPTTGQHLSLVTTQATVAEMNIDRDGDGKVDTVVQPVADLHGEEANDTTPPVITAGYTPTTGLLVTAIDSQSGVASISYTVDGIHFQAYTEPIIFTDQNIISVTVIAQDKAGNFSDPATVPVTVIASNTIYLPLIAR